MSGLNKGLRSVAISIPFLLFALLLTSSLPAQSCRVFEREMETLFMNHLPQTPVPKESLERIRSRCMEPTRKMLLIYNFFRAVDAYQSSGLSDREAYEFAVGYYNRSAEYFMLLTEYELEDPFFVTFYQRAEELESAIAQLGYQSGYRAMAPQSMVSSRMRGSSSSSTSMNARAQSATVRTSPEDWNRENAILPDRASIQVNQSNARMAGTANNQQWDRVSVTPSYRPSSSSNQRTTSSSQMRTTQQTRNPDTYAGVQYVGTMSSLDPVDYLNYSRSLQNQSNGANMRRGNDAFEANPNPQELWQYNYTDPSNANASARRQANTVNQAPAPAPKTEGAILVNVGTQTPLTNRPGKSSAAIKQLGYGEAAYRVAGVAPSVQHGETYVQVQTVDGQLGWLPQSLLIEDGRVAVVIQTVGARGIQGNNGITFFPGEPVVLARYENGQALAYGRDGKKAGWIADLRALSISEEDIELSDLIADAMSHTSIYARRAKLADIQRQPAYRSSPLAGVVDRLVAEEAQRQ